ncbi:MAG TPA: 16S rRNA (cytosine(1402)-N(4))-methyltransferase RsmH [Myxococcales bacterium]|jgi:16S rRNA (cytosine1402-N4)-methyltransferase|nr:16S rRNA (cytosine(1402)-N(4))-methyltransferase RsmH [Myxococcales bacterium]
MIDFLHQTVLQSEVAALLAAGPGRVIFDGTLGGGGHAQALLDAGARVVGIDQDPTALAAARARLSGRDVVIAHGNFRDARAVLDQLGFSEVDGALVDLGVSSPQLDDPGRGFSFRAGGPLDMRMDPTRGRPLRERLDEWDEKALARILDSLGEERFARRIARAIRKAWAASGIADTRQLADVVAAAIPRKAWPRDIHPATRTFQALRIAVNDELGALGDWLTQLPRVVARGGRAAAISFHSLEDRMVKQGFARLATGCICPPQLPVCACGRTAQWKVLTKKPVRAGEAELSENPRARSARLRAVERLS